MADFSFNFSLGATMASNFKAVVGQANAQIVGMGQSLRTMEKSVTGRLGTSFEASSIKLAKLTGELQAARTRLEELKNQAKAAGGANDLLARKISQAEKELSKLITKNRFAAESHRNLAASITTESGSVGVLMQDYRSLTTQMDKVRVKQAALSANLAAREVNVANRARLRGGMLDTVALAATVAVPVKLAVDFESGMADAAKTIEGMRDDSGSLTAKYYDMAQTAKELGRELPISHKEIASLMGAAGQMGLSDMKEIRTYTRDAAMMAVAFGMSNEEAAEAIGGYRTALGLSQDEMRDMLDLMNYFANTSSATEAGISDIVRRVGALGGVAGVSHKPLAALAATLDSMKVSPEIAATGIQNMMLAMNAGSAATQKQHEVLQELGFDAENLARRMQTDATGAIMDFMRALQALPAHQQAAALQRYFGRESVKSIAPLLTQLNLLEVNFRQVGDANKYAGAMEKEFSNRSKTTAAAFQITQNRAGELAITLGSVLLPPLNELLGIVGAGASAIADFTERYPQLTKVVGIATGSVISLAVASKALAYGYTFVKGGMLLAQGALLRFTAAQVTATATTNSMNLATNANAGASTLAARSTRGFAASMRGLTAAMIANPIGLVITGLALAITYWEEIKVFFEWAEKQRAAVIGAARDFGGDVRESIGLARTGTGSDMVEVSVNGQISQMTRAAAMRSGIQGAAQLPAVPGYAWGGVITRPTLAMVGEGGRAESIIPHDGSERSFWLWAQAGAALGLGLPALAAAKSATAAPGGSANTFSLPMTFNVQGLDESEFRKKMVSSRPDIEKIVQRAVVAMEHNRRRVNFVQ